METIAMRLSRKIIPPTLPPRPVDGGIVCAACGYDLRGMTDAGRCPECGVAIAASLAGGRKIYAHPLWVRQTRSALLLILGAAVVAIIGCFQQWSAARTVNQAVGSAWTIFPLASHLLAGLAAWGIAPEEPGHERFPWTSPMLRAGAVVVTAVPLLLLSSVWRLAPRFPTWADAACSAVLLASGFVTWLFYERLRQIALRFRWRRLRILSAVVAWALALASVGAAAVLSDYYGADGLNAYAAGLAPIVGLGSIGCIAPLWKKIASAGVAYMGTVLPLSAITSLFGIITVTMMYVELRTVIPPKAEGSG